MPTPMPPSSQLFTRARPATPHRGVHLDLKGNPPTPRRLLELLDLFAALRLNVVLAEWEDTFPWRRYPELRSPTAYDPATIAAFHAKADRLGLEVIPLVQCLGHAENVLGQPRFRALREQPDDAGELCASNPRSARLVIELVDEVLARSGPGLRRFHLGGDEAWHMGSCPRCRRAVAREGRAALYLRHVTPILDHLTARGVRPILWDDMMRKWPAAGQRAMGRRADLMAWSYEADPIRRDRGHLTVEHLRRFGRADVTLWGASAYKGGDGAWADVPDAAVRVRNNLAWVSEARRRGITGIVATAWSRYNTFMAPCETIEASLHTLTVAAAAMWDGRLPAEPIPAAEAWLRRWRGGREFRRFRACHGAAAELAKWQKGLVDWALTECERAAHRNGEPARLNPAVQRRYHDHLRKGLAQGRRLGAAFIRAHAGAIPRRWLDRYVESRFAPIARRVRAVLAPIRR